MSAKKTTPVKQVSKTAATASKVSPRAHSGTAVAPGAAAPDLLLVCVRDPFDAVGDSSTIVRAAVGTADGTAAHQWQLETVMEMNPPRFFASWATRGCFTLDLRVNAAVFPSTGTWGGTVRTTSGSGNCRVSVLRDASNKVRCSPASAACHAVEKAMPAPEERRFLNADIAIETNGPANLNAGAVAVISNINWPELIAGSTAATTGLAFDGKWRHNLDAADGDTTVSAEWAFAVMTREVYEALCLDHGWVPHITDDQ